MTMPTNKIARLWRTLDLTTADYNRDRFRLGILLAKLQAAYSERSEVRQTVSPSLGHGTFERECIRRGYKPRTVRALIADAKVILAQAARKKTIREHEKRNGGPCECFHCIGEAGYRTTAEKRRAARAAHRKREDAWRRTARKVADAFSNHPDNCLIEFAALLPFHAMKAAYKIAARHYHPDMGGDAEKMVRLNQLWERLEAIHASMDAAEPVAEVRVN
jgi:hypothetical protein